MNLEKALKDLIPQSKEKVEYFTGIDGYVIPLLKRIEVRQSPIRQVINGRDVAKFHLMTDDLVHQVISKRADLGLQFKSIISYEDRDLKIEQSNKKALKETKYLPEELSEMKGMYCSFGEYLVISNLDPEDTVGVVIKDQRIAEGFNTLFEGLWKVGKKV